jgi:hypothetical protein
MPGGKRDGRTGRNGREGTLKLGEQQLAVAGCV